MADISWDEYFLKICEDVSKRSTCPSRLVGCVIVNPETKHIISTGYNGAPRGTAHCDEKCAARESGKNYSDCKAIHAEINAIVAAALNGTSTNGATIYLPTTPCIYCARVLINAGIKIVVCSSVYPHPEALDLLKEGGVELRMINEA